MAFPPAAAVFAGVAFLAAFFAGLFVGVAAVFAAFGAATA
jgi:hypothetical protein